MWNLNHGVVVHTHILPAHVIRIRVDHVQTAQTAVAVLKSITVAASHQVVPPPNITVFCVAVPLDTSNVNKLLLYAQL